MKLGAYAFTYDDWREKDYPLDLWIEWHSKIFDSIVLVYVGDIYKLKGLEVPENVDILFVPYDRVKGRDYAFLKNLAQKSLKTEWKMLLDIDEFITERPRLRTSNIYIHNLFGDVYHEIIHKGVGEGKSVSGHVPWIRLHKGDRPVVKDGCTVIGEGFIHDPIEVYHTTLLRNPYELANRTGYWRINKKFDYSKWKEFWKDSIVKHVNPFSLPKILLDNSERFEYCRNKRLLD